MKKCAILVSVATIAIPLIFQNCGGFSETVTDNTLVAGSTPAPPAKVCPTPAAPVYANQETQQYVVGSFSFLNSGQSKYRFSINAEVGASFAFQFSLPANQVGMAGTIITSSGPHTEVAISECPGDFAADGYCRSRGVEVSTVRYVVSPLTDTRECNLVANKIYYLNVRRNADCTGLLSCDFYVVRPSMATFNW